MDNLTESLKEAIEAATKALLALILVLAILLARTLQALFTLARPALLVGCVILAGYGAVTLFPVVLAKYGGDAPAVLLALVSVVIVPVGLLVLAGDYGAWAVLAASGALMVLAREAIARSPPAVLVGYPLVALSGCVVYFAFVEPKAQNEREESGGQEQIGNIGITLDRDGGADNLHGDQEL